jgi:hypothetical protein
MRSLLATAIDDSIDTLTPEALTTLVNSSERWHLPVARKAPTLTPELREELSTHKDPAVRKAIAARGDTSTKIMNELLADANTSVSATAFTHAKKSIITPNLVASFIKSGKVGHYDAILEREDTHDLLSKADAVLLFR